VLCVRALSIKTQVMRFLTINYKNFWLIFWTQSIILAPPTKVSEVSSVSFIRLQNKLMNYTLLCPLSMPVSHNLLKETHLVTEILCFKKLALQCTRYSTKLRWTESAGCSKDNAWFECLPRHRLSWLMCFVVPLLPSTKIRHYCLLPNPLHSPHPPVTLPFNIIHSRYWQRRKFAGSIPDEVNGFFNWPNPSSHTTSLGATQPLTEMSSRNLRGGEGRPARKADVSPACYKFW
jgi:hypothetical protein